MCCFRRCFFQTFYTWWSSFWHLWCSKCNFCVSAFSKPRVGEFGLRRGCQWTGNSPATAMKNYALVRRTDFVDGGNSVAKSDAILAPDVKSDAVPASTGKRRPNKKRTAENGRSLQCVIVDDIGLESTAETREFCTFDPKATPNPTPSFEDDKLAQIVAQWPLLSGDLKAKIFECVVAESRLADSLRSA